MTSMVARILASVGSAVGIAGCSGEIFHRFTADDNQWLSVDARQRAIISSKVETMATPGQVTPTRVICAEPSPDVALVAATSFGIGASILGKGTGSLTGSSAEGLAQLAERMATIQVLRDGLYRACEAYANGAISSTTYAVLISGVDDTLVTMLMGEMAAGAFGRPLAAIGTSTSADAQATLTVFAAQAAETKESLDELRKTNDAIADKDAECEVLRANVDAAAGDPEEDSAVKKCKGERDVLETERTRLQEKLRDTLSASARSLAKVNRLIAGGKLNAQASDVVADEIREIHQQYLEQPKGSAVVLACIAALDNVMRTTPSTEALPAGLPMLCNETILPGFVTSLEAEAALKLEEAGRATAEAETRRNTCKALTSDGEVTAEDRAACL